VRPKMGAQDWLVGVQGERRRNTTPSLNVAVVWSLSLAIFAEPGDITVPYLAAQGERLSHERSIVLVPVSGA
jgi:hypothetical protein